MANFSEKTIQPNLFDVSFKNPLLSEAHQIIYELYLGVCSQRLYIEHQLSLPTELRVITTQEDMGFTDDLQETLNYLKEREDKYKAILIYLQSL